MPWKLVFCRCTCSESLAGYFVIPLAGLPEEARPGLIGLRAAVSSVSRPSRGAAAAMQISQLHAGVSGRPLPIRARQHVAVGRSTQVIVAGKARIIGKESRIGKAPITVPAGVTFDVQGQTITVKVCCEHCTAPVVSLGYVDGPLLIPTAVPHPHGKHGFVCAGQRPRDVGDTPKPLVHRAGETGKRIHRAAMGHSDWSLYSLGCRVSTSHC